MTNFNKSDNGMIILFNGIGVVVAYGMWGIGILLLTLALVNFVKLRFDERLSEDRITRVEEARNERILAEYVGGEDPKD